MISLDPRLEGGSLNTRTTEQILDVLTLRGVDHVFLPCPKAPVVDPASAALAPPGAAGAPAGIPTFGPAPLMVLLSSLKALPTITRLQMPSAPASTRCTRSTWRSMSGRSSGDLSREGGCLGSCSMLPLERLRRAPAAVAMGWP
jgi:hypothetical protein